MADGPKTILEEAAGLVFGDRRDQYGAITHQITSVAQYWSKYLVDRGWVPPESGNLTGADVAFLNALQKISRHACGTPKRDTFVDLAGYGQVGAVCAGFDEEK